MSKTITLSLNKALIFEAVKAESFNTGQTDKAADPVRNAAAAAYEQAGGQPHDERMLLRHLKASIGKFEAQMAEFLESQSGCVSDTLSTSQDSFTITLVVSDRFNSGLAAPLSSLCEDFLVCHMLASWWNLFKPDYAKNYYLNAQDALNHIRLCFSKTSPAAAGGDYTDVTGTVNYNM